MLGRTALRARVKPPGLESTALCSLLRPASTASSRLWAWCQPVCRHWNWLVFPIDTSIKWE